MPNDWTISAWTADWTTVDWTIWTVTALATTVLIGWTIRTIARSGLEQRLQLFTGTVQLFTAWTVMHGTFQFFRQVLDMPTHEAWITAGTIEAVMWVGAAMVFLHGRKTDTTGWGPGGPLFIAAGVGGAILAVLASAYWQQGVGRIVVVVLGMWNLTAQLLKATRRATGNSTDYAPSRWSLRYWRERRARFNPTEWEIRRLARAIRWSNGRWPFSPLGLWLLTRRSEKVRPTVLTEARRRAALVHALRSNVAWTSPVMAEMVQKADAWTGSTDGVWTIGSDPDRSDVPALDRSPDHGPDHEPDRSLDRRTGPARSGPRSTMVQPVRTIEGTVTALDHPDHDGPVQTVQDGPALPDRMTAKVAQVKAHVGDDWPDIVFTGQSIMDMKLTGLRNKTLCNELAGLLNQMAEKERAARMAPLTH